jgi:hypothetical protein
MADLARPDGERRLYQSRIAAGSVTAVAKFMNPGTLA